MQARLDYVQASPGASKALLAVEISLRDCGREPALRDLVKLRASPINGCAFCIDRHTKDASARGETEQRLYA
jgi:AhpD family alkylhydroperoxidase